MVSAIGACRQILRFLTCFVLMFLGFVSQRTCASFRPPPAPQVFSSLFPRACIMFFASFSLEWTLADSQNHSSIGGQSLLTFLRAKNNNNSSVGGQEFHKFL